MGLFKSQWQNGKMESSFFNISSETSFGGVFVGDWQNGKMESEQKLEKNHKSQEKFWGSLNPSGKIERWKVLSLI